MLVCIECNDSGPLKRKYTNVSITFFLMWDEVGVKHVRICMDESI